MMEAVIEFEFCFLNSWPQFDKKGIMRQTYTTRTKRVNKMYRIHIYNDSFGTRYITLSLGDSL
jgi:hypothetical protein